MKLPVKLRHLLSSQKKTIQCQRLNRTPFYKKCPAGRAVFLRDSRTHINFERQFIYSRIPKAANSTVIATLYCHSGDVPTRDFIEAIKAGMRRPSELSQNETQDIISNYFAFTLTRNPYARFMSCYLDKIAKKSSFRAKAALSLTGNVNSKVTLDQFIEFLSYKNNLLMDAHWAPQVSCLAFPIKNYDLIGSVETLAEDIQRICAHLCLDRDVVSYIPHATQAQKLLYDLRPDQVAKIASIYASDFEHLGYPKDIRSAQVAPGCRKG